jgi:hypothetical protein
MSQMTVTERVLALPKSIGCHTYLYLIE